MKSLLIILIGLLGLIVGTTGLILGEADDSPGLQGLGVLLTLGSVFLAARASRLRARDSPGDP